MIKVKYTSNSVKISGHANYAEHGKDIVCASVSSIIITSINNMLSIDEESIIYTDDNVVVNIKLINDNQLVKKLFCNLINLLKDLSEDYKDYIKVESEEY